MAATTTLTCTKLASHRSRGTAVSLALATLSSLTPSDYSHSRSPPYSFDRVSVGDKENFSPFETTTSLQLKREPLSDITNSFLSPFLSTSPSPTSTSSLLPATATNTNHPTIRSTGARPRSSLHRIVVGSLHRKKAICRRRNAISLSSHQASLLAMQLSTPSSVATSPSPVDVKKSQNIEEAIKTNVRFRTIALERNVFLISRTDGHSFSCNACNCSCSTSQTVVSAPSLAA